MVGHRGFGERLGEQPGQPVGVGVQGGVRGVVGGLQGGQPGGHRHRVPGQGAGLVHRPQRGQPFHHLGAAAERRGGQPTAHHLAEGEQVRVHRVQAVPAGAADPEPGHHLVEDQQGAVLGGDAAQRGVVAGLRRDRAHVAGGGGGAAGAEPVAGPARSRPGSARRRTIRRPPPAARPPPRPGGRGRGSSGPRSRPGRRSGCRPHRSASSRRPW